MKSRRQIKQVLYRLAVGRHDIYQAAQTCQTILRMRPAFEDPLYFPLQESVVIAYSRPFSGGKIGNLPNRYERFANPRHASQHRELLQLRNTIVAHSDRDIRQVVIYPAGAKYGSMVVPKTGIQVLGKVYEPVFFESVEDLCATQLTRLNEGIEELLSSLYPDGSTGGDRFFLEDDEVS